MVFKTDIDMSIWNSHERVSFCLVHDPSGKAGYKISCIEVHFKIHISVASACHILKPCPAWISDAAWLTKSTWAPQFQETVFYIQYYNIQTPTCAQIFYSTRTVCTVNRNSHLWTWHKIESRTSYMITFSGEHNVRSSIGILDCIISSLGKL